MTDDRAKASAKDRSEGAWVCNECGAREYTGCVSHDDACDMGCGRCGGVEFHWEDPRAAASLSTQQENR